MSTSSAYTSSSHPQSFNSKTQQAALPPTAPNYIPKGGKALTPKTPHLSSFSMLVGSTRLPSWKGDLGVLGWEAQPGASLGLSASGLLCSCAWERRELSL